MLANPKSLWLPYTQMQTAAAFPKAIKTKGEFITLENGQTLIDGLASWWTACHGYNHRTILKAVYDQMIQMPHIMLGGFVHEPALQFAEQLTAVAPGDLNHVFFSDSGSVAVEIALKIAIQFWKNRGFETRNKFICFHGGYHGDTVGAMSVSDPQLNFHRTFRDCIPHQCLLSLPKSKTELEHFDRYLSIYRNQLAGVIIEPLIQGASGMRTHAPHVLKEIAKRVREHKLLLIADEVFTGLGRTGTLFACEQAFVVPDIMVLAKALTGGVLTMGATLVTSQVFERFLSKREQAAFMHGPTYMGNPLACCAGIASLSLFEREKTLTKVKQMEAFFKERLQPLEQLSGIREVRIQGAMAAVEFLNLDKEKLQQLLDEHSVWLRPIGNVLYTTPALNIAKESLEKIIEVIEVSAHMHSEIKDRKVSV